LNATLGLRGVSGSQQKPASYWSMPLETALTVYLRSLPAEIGGGPQAPGRGQGF